MNGFDDLLNYNPAEGQGQQLTKEEYSAMRQAEREAVFELSDNTALEVAGDGGKFQQYLDVQSTFDRYSAVNALLIMAQKPDATRVADFDTWKGRGGFIKGKSDISILERHNYTKEDGSPGIGYNVKKVFDVSQVDTRRMRTPAPTPTRSERQILAALISKYPLKITGVDDLPDNQGAMTDLDGSILVRKGMEFSDTFRSVAYEMACAEVAADPELSPEQEFSAYSATYMLCKKYGADTKQFSFDNAPSVFDGMDAQEVKGELSQIRDAADAISGRMARQLEKPARSGEAR
ncbi:MAG: hypothetical protein LBH95_01370 [Oscillospiraceae bacterium]|jgi:hypothetical protein|nr:hypothetical protein [Oscillospiraceae bacterium]